MKNAEELRKEIADLEEQARYQEWSERVDIRLTRALHELLCDWPSHEPGECSFDYEVSWGTVVSTTDWRSAHARWHRLAMLVLNIVNGSIERMLKEGDVEEVLGMIRALPMRIKRTV
jgi:hypothetical protein